MTNELMPKGIKGFQKGHSVPGDLRDKLRELRLGTKLSTETKQKMSIAQKGKKMPAGSKVFSQEFREQARLRMLGKKQSPELIAKRVASRKGYTHSEETKYKISIANEGDNSPHWKGDEVSYSGLHSWVRRKLGKAKICGLCFATEKVEWANLSHKYKRDINDWVALCAKCHRSYDKGRSDIKYHFLNQGRKL